MFKSGSKKSEQEIDLHQEARFDINQVKPGQFWSIGDLFSFQGHKYLMVCPGRSADPASPPLNDNKKTLHDYHFSEFDKY